MKRPAPDPRISYARSERSADLHWIAGTLVRWSLSQEVTTSPACGRPVGLATTGVSARPPAAGHASCESGLNPSTPSL